MFFFRSEKDIPQYVLELLVDKSFLTLIIFQGGHCLPKSTTPLTPVTPACTVEYGKYLEAEQTQAILKTCRSLRISFGSTFGPLSQVALAKVLHRRRRTLPPGDWERRVREPMHFYGPMNLRTRMPAEWRKVEGMTQICTFLGYYGNTLPHMPSKESTEPSLDELLSRQTFLLRCQTCKAQADSFFRHPYLYEMSAVRSRKRLHYTYNVAKLLERKEAGENIERELADFSASLVSNLPVYSNTGSSLGSVCLPTFNWLCAHHVGTGSRYHAPRVSSIYSLYVYPTVLPDVLTLVQLPLRR